MPYASRYPLETIEAARTLYREGTRVRDIAQATGMSVGALYYHLDGRALPGLAPPRLPRRREGNASAAMPMPSRGRERLAARLFRAAEKQAKKIERSLAWEFQRKEDRAHDLAALRELTRILRDLSVVEEFGARGRAEGTAGAERRARAGAGGGGTRGGGEPDEGGVREPPATSPLRGGRRLADAKQTANFGRG